MEEVSIDIRDLDYRWFEGVKAFLDRDHDQYHFPLESVERLGEPDEESGKYYLTAADIEAEVNRIDYEGQSIPAWSVDCAKLIVRPARARTIN